MPLPPLLAALAHATGDPGLLDPALLPDPARRLEPNGGYDPDREAAARLRAGAALDAWEEGPGVSAVVDETFVRRAVEFCLGGPLAERSYAMVREELVLPGEDRRAPGWRVADLAPGRRMRATVIGAGMSGILCAHRLRQAGLEVRILEQADGLGGTWRENRYPGCRVDVPNHLYSYSFATRADWPQQFSDQRVLLDYFRSVAAELGLDACMEFGTEVVAATWHEDDACWTVTARGPDGVEVHHETEVIVSAVGQLHRPLVPSIPGRETFAGPTFHTARWDPSVELAGRRVAVVGAAASAVQCVPRIQPDVAALTVLQRTPNWFLPAPNYQDPLAPSLREVLDALPQFKEWYRIFLFWRLSEGLMPGTVPGPANDMFRAFFTEYLRAEFADRPDLFAATLPEYPPFSKRVVLDDGSWPRALRADNTTLVTAGIVAIDETGIVTDDGRHHDADVIIWATGFEASQFLAPMRIVGRGGADLRSRWAGDARAYLGVTVPDFPNLFCLYGPNTNLVANGSIIFFSECEVNHVLDVLRITLEAGARSADCRPEACDRHNEMVDAGNAARVWGQADVPSWYRNAAGRVTQNWPGTLEEYWALTRTADPADYRLR